MNRMHIPIILIILIPLVMTVSACTLFPDREVSEAEPRSTATGDPSLITTVIVTETFGVKECTLVDCQSTLDVILAAEIDGDYFVKAVDNSSGDTAIVHCFGGELGKEPAEERSTQFDDPADLEAGTLRQLAQECDSSSGYVLQKYGGGEISTTVVQCYASTPPLTLDGWCTADGVKFIHFVPQDVTLTLHWDGGEVTRQFQPQYTEFAPNGPDCPPVCWNAEVELGE